MTAEKRSAIERLLRGISTGHVETVRDAWRELLEGGANSVSIIREKLESSAWAEYPRGPLARYFGVLLALLDELDPSAFETEVSRLAKLQLHPLHRRTLDLLSQRLDEDPALRLADGTPVFVSSEIHDRAIVIRNIDLWSKTKGLSLNDVTRIDVIGANPHLDFAGKYNLYFSTIILTWPTERVRGVKLWFRRLYAEFVFYHEVGHHVCGHDEGGSVAEQEEEADAYAHSMMRRSRPVFINVGRLLLWPLRFLLKRAKTSATEGTPEAN